jgi:hypothetical protein
LRAVAIIRHPQMAFGGVVILRRDDRVRLPSAWAVQPVRPMRGGDLLATLGFIANRWCLERGLSSVSPTPGKRREFLRNGFLYAAFAPGGIGDRIQWELLEVFRRKGSNCWWIELGSAGKAPSGLILLAAVFILMNTRDGEVGCRTMRWRITCGSSPRRDFGARTYTYSQALLFPVRVWPHGHRRPGDSHLTRPDWQWLSERIWRN